MLLPSHPMQFLRQRINPLVIERAVGECQHASADLDHDGMSGLDDFLAQRIRHEASRLGTRSTDARVSRAVRGGNACWRIPLGSMNRRYRARRQAFFGRLETCPTALS